MILQLFLITGILGCSTYGLTVDEFREKIEPKCYDFKDNKELINGQISPLPSSLETFVNIVERLEDNGYSMDKILRSFIASFRCDDLEYSPPYDSEAGGFTTRGSEAVSRAHQILLELLGGGINDDIRATDISEDERCALYFMISHTVNDTKLDNVPEEETLRHPREQGVVNLNTKTRHSIALGKVLLGILAGLRGSEQEVSASEILNRLGRKTNGAEGDNINVLYGVTTSDIFTLTWHWRKDIKSPYCKNQLLLPNGYWDDSVCPTKYILDDVSESQCYATNALLRGAVDGLILGLKIKDLQSSISNIRLSQVLRMYYGLNTPSSDTLLSELSWCNRHSLFTSQEQDIVRHAFLYSKLYSALLSNPVPSLELPINDIMNAIRSYKPQVFDDVYNEGECSKSVSTASKICETPRNVTAVLDYKSVNKDNQYQIIGNLSVGFHMGLIGGSSMAVYTNLKPLGGGFELHSINISEISGCASCAAKYFDYFGQPTTSTENEVEVFRDLNRTLVPDDLLGDDENEPGAPAKVVLYFNYATNIDNSQELKDTIWEFRKHHKGVRVLAVGTKKEALTPFVENADNDIILQTEARALTTLNDKICKVPAQFQFKNCYKNSRSEEDANVFQGHITPYHVQYWAMNPKYFLKSFNIKMTFTARQGKVQVCYTRNYDDIISNTQTRMNCQTAESDKPVDFYVKDPCKKYNVYNCRPFIFRIEAQSVPTQKCQDKMCVTPNQIQFEFKHTGISCNKGISCVANSAMTLIIVMFISMFFVFKN